MAIYEVAYSTRPVSNREMSYSDIVLVEAETREALTEKIVDLICNLGPPDNYYVDSIGGNPYEPRPKKRVAKKVARDFDNLVSIINALILARNQGP
jgi:hypothetical protein